MREKRSGGYWGVENGMSCVDGLGIEYGDRCRVCGPRGEETACVSERVVQSTYDIVVGAELVGREKLCCDGGM